MTNKTFLIIATLTLVSTFSKAQDTKQWTLQDCINYAMEHNIQLQQNRIAEEQGEVSLKQSKAVLFPSLTFNMSQSVNYRPLQDSPSNLVTNGMATSSSRKATANGSYGLNASWTVWNGGANTKNIKVQEVTNNITALNTQQTEQNIQEQIAQLYVQILYSQEAEKVNQAMLSTAETQFQRGEEMLNVGQISKADLAQLHSQLSSCKYNVVQTQTQTAQFKLQLKNLLELNYQQSFDIASTTPSDEKALEMIPTREEVINQAFVTRPEIRSSELSVEAAELDLAVAKAGYWPTISINAGVGDSHNSASQYEWGEQMKQNLNASIGISLAVPILDNRRNKTAVEKAKLAKTNKQLDLQDQRNALTSTIEEYWLNAYTSQQKFVAAKSKAESMEASYTLLDEQFKHGLKNIVELLTGRDNLMSAQQERLQSKYTAILNLKLLQFYQGQPIEL